MASRKDKKAWIENRDTPQLFNSARLTTKCLWCRKEVQRSMHFDLDGVCPQARAYSDLRDLDLSFDMGEHDPDYNGPNGDRAYSLRKELKYGTR